MHPRLLVVALALAACATPQTMNPPTASSVTAMLPAGAEAWSLFGEPLLPPPLSPDTRAEYEARLAEARADFERNPGSADAAIWLGRRTAYLGRYRDAIDIYTNAIAQHRFEPRLYRHRGHRFITVRQFDDAVADLTYASDLVAGQADQVEPDGIPNTRDIPTSTLQSNIWYHLGLGHYLNGDLDAARRAYHAALGVSTTPDMRVATSHWLYMTLRRMRRPVDAAALLTSIQRDMDIIENQDYHRLLLMYKGLLTPDELLGASRVASPDALDPTVGYGVANWHLYNGRREQAIAMFQRILTSDQWAAFGYVAAEADLRRLGRTPTRSRPPAEPVTMQTRTAR